VGSECEFWQSERSFILFFSLCIIQYEALVNEYSGSECATGGSVASEYPAKQKYFMGGCEFYQYEGTYIFNQITTQK